MSKTARRVVKFFRMSVLPNRKAWNLKPVPIEKISLKLGLRTSSSNWEGFGVESQAIFPSYRQINVCRNPDIANWIGLTPTSKLLQLVKMVLSHKFKTVSFHWDRFNACNPTGWATRSSASKMTIPGWMDITRFQQWVVMTFKWISIIDTFWKPSKPVPGEWYHSREAIKRLIQSLQSFSICGILDAISSLLPD